MTAAASIMYNSDLTETRRAHLLDRHKQFQFVFAIATAHELCHVFVAYLSRNTNNGERFTPGGVTFLEYGESEEVGESGRFIENLLFGGAMEWYRDRNDDDGQVSINSSLAPSPVALSRNMPVAHTLTIIIGRYSPPCERGRRGLENRP
jgi:hypothetical protein